MFKFDKEGNLIEEEVSLESADGTIEIDPEVMSEEDRCLIIEAALLDSMSRDELKAYLESDEFQQDVENGVLTESIKTKVKLNRYAEEKRRAKMAVFSIARERKDPEMRKLEKAWAKARKAEEKLAKKYGTEALKRARKAMAAKKNEASNAVKKATTNTAEDRSLKGMFKYVK